MLVYILWLERCLISMCLKWNTGIDEVMRLSPPSTPPVGDLRTHRVHILGTISTFFHCNSTQMTESNRIMWRPGGWRRKRGRSPGGYTLPLHPPFPCPYLPGLEGHVMEEDNTSRCQPPMITGSETGLTYEDYSAPLMDVGLWPRLTRKQIATLSPCKVLFCQVKKREKREWERERVSSLWFPWQLLQSVYFLYQLLNFLQHQKHEDPSISICLNSFWMQ